MGVEFERRAKRKKAINNIRSNFIKIELKIAPQPPTALVAHTCVFAAK